MVRIPFFDFDEPAPEPAEDPAVAQAAAEAAHEAADQAAREVLYGREHAYAIRFGNDALRREQPALDAIDRGYRAARAGLGPEAQAAFDARADARRQAWRDQVQGMAADQRAKVKLESARLREHYAAYDLYRAVERGDHAAAEAHADLLHQAAAQHGRLSALDPAAAAAQAAGKVGETLASGVTRVAAADPQAAQAALDRHGQRMGDEHRATAQAAVASGAADAEPTDEAEVEADGGMAQLNAMGPLNSAGLPVNHYFGPDGGPQPVRRALTPSSPPPGAAAKSARFRADVPIALWSPLDVTGGMDRPVPPVQHEDSFSDRLLRAVGLDPAPHERIDPRGGPGWDDPAVLREIGDLHPEPDLGALGRAVETQGHAQSSATVSTGQNDPGGVSYGDSQFATHSENIPKFLKHQGARWAQQFAGLKPGTPAFSAAWQRVAAANGKAFSEAIYRYSEQYLYGAQLKMVREDQSRLPPEARVDLASRSVALRNLVWSVAINGQNSNAIVRGLRNAQAATRGSPSDQQIIDAICTERERRDRQGVLVYFGNATRAGAEKGVVNRLTHERDWASYLLQMEQARAIPVLHFR